MNFSTFKNWTIQREKCVYVDREKERERHIIIQ